jgi:ABC-type polysaccharide/polyol phosphate transport system ATPase subunit
MAVIKFDNVSKKYKLYSKGGLYLRDRITHALQRLNPFNGTQRSALTAQQPLEKDFWALKNVSFEIKQGESVGFIGRNGAGKSTILKLLAGVTKPSSGNVEVNGRVAALIEVGAGFHPELTGRENVFLNGSILGMRKAEIEKSFDSIVSFSELEQFLDTPVKHYSSGMYVRLGFAIAVHTDPDIFLIDEVLAVGDEAFQKKCLDTLAAHNAAGKTIILVSHDLAKVQEVCDRCIYIGQGQIKQDGVPANIIRQYRFDVAGMQSDGPKLHTEFGQSAEILDVIFRRHDGRECSEFKTGDDLVIEVRYWAHRRIENPVFIVDIDGRKGAHVTGISTRSDGIIIDSIEGKSSIFCRVPQLTLNEGIYSVNVELDNSEDGEIYDRHFGRYKFIVGTGAEHRWGLVRFRAEWAWNPSFTQRLSSSDSPLLRLNKLVEH